MYDCIEKCHRGSVFQVKGRDQYQICYGNVLLLLNFAQLSDLYLFLLNTDLLKLDDLKEEPANKIIISLSRLVGGFAFTDDEFLDFRELILNAHSILNLSKEVDAILKN